MDCTIKVAKTNALISCAITVLLICAFGLAYANRRFACTPDSFPHFTRFNKAYLVSLFDIFGRPFGKTQT